jgi:amidohydrolase
MTANYLATAESNFEYTRNLRRDFHAHPELGFKEFRTSDIVARELNAIGLEVASGIAETGVIAMHDTGRPGPTALLRFDMDALPIQEETGAEYASQTPGIMHACGHDGHTAIGLTVARMLRENSDHLAGRIKFVFQPAEEGLGGAARMVSEGVLDNPRPDFSLALHLWNVKPFGWLGITPGPTMAASDTFKIILRGNGGHGASPHLSTDPVLASAHVITALQSIVSRDVEPLKAAVVSVTALNSGRAFNVIPSDAELLGTIRSFDPDIRRRVLRRLDEIVNGVGRSMGCHPEIELKSITPAVVNDEGLSREIQKIATDLFPDSVIDTTSRTMGSEDMAFMMDDIPGCYFFVGSANPEQGLDAAHHNPRFDFDERALQSGAALMASAAAKLLQI